MPLERPTNFVLLKLAGMWWLSFFRRKTFLLNLKANLRCSTHFWSFKKFKLKKQMNNFEFLMRFWPSNDATVIVRVYSSFNLFMRSTISSLSFGWKHMQISYWISFKVFMKIKILQLTFRFWPKHYLDVTLPRCF